MGYALLPRKHWKQQDYLLYTYDVIADMLRQADKKDLSAVTLEFADLAQGISFEKADDIFNWMDNNGYHDASIKLFERHVFFSLLKDFCFYIYESISCAARGKVTVAYTLLRKPIRDNLLYLEWLLSDKEDFYNKLLYHNFNEYDISKIKADKIEYIVKSASQKSYMGAAINSNNDVYTFRFSRKEEIGLQRIWDQSMHLVTCNKNYKTDDGNLNFIFATNDIWNDYWNYYYIVLPQLMAYAIEICEALFLNIVKLDEFELLLNRTIRFNKYANIHPKIKVMDIFRIQPIKLVALLKENNIEATMKCECCTNDILISHKIVKEMIENWTVICPHCGQEHNICKYYTDINYIKN